MKHARADYDGIQDANNHIPDDEPVFVIRAKDICSAATVEMWALLAEQAGADPDMIESARKHAAVMRAYGQAHGWTVPDLPSNK